MNVYRMKIQQKEQFDSYNVFGLGSPNDAYAQYFIGQSYLNPLTEPKDSSVFLANVTFAAAIIGISTAPKVAEGSSSSVQPEKVGIRNTENKPSAFVRAW